ncbi:MAG: DoxX family protein [Bacteroidota bacterium]
MKTKTWYWIVTGIFAAFMLFTAIPDIMVAPDAVTFITALGYPVYFVAFIGVAKLLGVIGILVPSFKRIKEWAYSGLFFDLVGATYSVIAKYGVQKEQSFMLLIVGFLFLSYYLWHKTEQQKAGLRA